MSVDAGGNHVRGRKGRQDQSAETRARIVNAALDALGSTGAGGLRVGNVARTAGVTTGAVYAHFGDRDGLVAAAHIEYMRRAVDAVGERRRQATPANETSGPTPAVANYVAMLMEPDALFERRRWADAAQAGHRNDELRRELASIIGTQLEASTALIEQSQERGWIDESLDPTAIATVQLALSVGMSLFGDLFDESFVAKEDLIAVWQRVPLGLAPVPEADAEKVS